MCVAVQNLPREVHYQVDNVILCGVIPGTKEPQYTIASYLSPLVDELAQLWEGVAAFAPSKHKKQCSSGVPVAKIYDPSPVFYIALLPTHPMRHIMIFIIFCILLINIHKKIARPTSQQRYNNIHKNIFKFLTY